MAFQANAFQSNAFQVCASTKPETKYKRVWLPEAKEKLEEYKKVWWIFSQFERTTKGHVFTGEHFFAHGTDLIPWMEKQSKKILEGTPTYGGLNHWNQCLALLEGKVSEATLAKLDHSFHKKGCGLNDPKIGWADVEKYGIKLDSHRLAEHLRELILERM